MSLRLEMLQVARLAPRLLGDSTDLVQRFLLGQQHPDGGFVDREGNSDLYYTVFGLDALHALRMPVPSESVSRYLASFGDGESLDFVHLCCLARCWAAIAGGPARDGREGHDASAWRYAVAQRLERFRTHDGGYHPKPGSVGGTAYGAFLGLGAYEDLRVPLPNAGDLGESLNRLAAADGGWSNERIGGATSSGGEVKVGTGSTNATAAAVMVLRHLAQPVLPATGEWLRQQAHPQGGFKAAPATPMPDLLSTATALHALAALQVPIEECREACLDYVDSLWTNEGSFHGHWADSVLDVEYTYYGLLALGHLSL